jgi:teichuronic acid biosynthesis glycosyltransferase TuaC
VLRILSLSSVYPTPHNPGAGLFVRARLQRMAVRSELKVLAPVFLFDAKSGTGRGWRRDGAAEVLHPSWFYLPGSGVLTPVLLGIEMWWPLVRLRRTFPFQVIDAHFGYPEGIAAAMLAALTRSPFTITFRGSEFLHGGYPLRRRLLRWALRRANRVIAVSEQLRQLAVAMGADPARTRAIPNGLDTSLYWPRDRCQARRKHGISADALIILTAGHLIELKGHHHAVAALKSLREKGVAAQLLIAGGEPSRGLPSFEPKIRRLVVELGLQDHVRFVGQVTPDTLAELMSAANVFCLASSREGWPNVVHEAMGCGTPVVATRVGAVPELIPSDRYGLIVAPNDPAALAEGFAEALRKNWDREAVCAWAQSRSWEQVAAEVLEQMQEIVDETHGNSRQQRQIPEVTGG